MLEVREVCTYYGRIRALDHVSLSVAEGEIVSLIGANGAGKTTLLNTISGITPAAQGEVYFGARPITRMPAEQLVRLGISHVPERRQVFSSLNVLENLTLGAYCRAGKESQTAIRVDIKRMFSLFPVLKDRRAQLAGTLSGGEQQMLAVARGLMARPKLMLLDEPSLGLAPLIVQEIFRIIGDLRRNGTTILLVEQNARAALRVADRGYVLENGRVVMSGAAEALARNEQLQRAYLGRKNHRSRRGG
ncbi:MAG TPA: ABC transporter ATP-binding protein [Anaerolineales bacterium]|nr:ABC transporter ATP-binding protein [Anaerolineales bacterium]